MNLAKPSAGDLDEVPFFSTPAIANQKQELPAYMAASNRTALDVNKLRRMVGKVATYQNQLPSGYRAVQALSAAAERAFSLLSNRYSLTTSFTGRLHFHISYVAV